MTNASGRIGGRHTVRPDITDPADCHGATWRSAGRFCGRRPCKTCCLLLTIWRETATIAGVRFAYICVRTEALPHERVCDVGGCFPLAALAGSRGDVC